MIMNIKTMKKVINKENCERYRKAKIKFWK